jgi:hypothetical protein
MLPFFSLHLFLTGLIKVIKTFKKLYHNFSISDLSQSITTKTKNLFINVPNMLMIRQHSKKCLSQTIFFLSLKAINFSLISKANLTSSN